MKPPTAFSRDNAASDRRLSACKDCEAARVRRSNREAFPACMALGAAETVGGIRDVAKRHGFDSAFELEVAAELDAARVDAEREGAVIYYRDASGVSRRWTPDWRAASGVVLEAKGRVTLRDQTVIPAVLSQNPSLDLRLVLQRPHRRDGVEGVNLTPAGWAATLGLRWTTLGSVGAITDDLPRVVLTEEGDRVIPDWQDDGQPATAKAAELWGPSRSV